MEGQKYKVVKEEGFNHNFSIGNIVRLVQKERSSGAYIRRDGLIQWLRDDEVVKCPSSPSVHNINDCNNLDIPISFRILAFETEKEPKDVAWAELQFLKK